MAEQFYSILTSIGKTKIANANALGNKLNLKTLVLGDGNGKYYNPTENQEALVNEVWKGNIGSITTNSKNPNWIVIETIIAGNVGGFFIREVGIFDDEGSLIAIGKYPETYKPVISDGSTKDLIIRMILEVSNSANVTLKIDPAIIMATKKDVEVLENKIRDLKGVYAEDLLDETVIIEGEIHPLIKSEFEKVETKINENKENFESQMAESTTILTPTGTANSIILDITMSDKKKYSFKAIANSTGNVTINGKPFKKPDGTQIGSGGIKVNKVYDFYYDLASESVFILAKAIGNAAVGDVLAGKTFSNSDDNELIGTMPNRGSLDVIVTQIAGNDIPIGYHNGLGKAKIKIEPGDTIAYRATNAVGRTNDEWSTVREVRIDTAGRYRISFNLRLGDYTATGHGRIYKNGYAYGIMREIRTNIDTMFTEDFTFEFGDLVQLRLSSNGRTTLTNAEFNISFDAVLPTITKI